MSISPKPIKLTPAQFVSQWMGADHKFQVNVHNFEVNAGKAAVETFKKSFDLKRFNGASGKSWPAWQGSYSGKGTLMDETGTLKNSIKVKSIRNHQITIFTDPADFQNGPARHKGFCYAAVHNNLNSISHKPPRGPKRERQFIGHSTELQQKLKKSSVHLFDGLPL